MAWPELRKAKSRADAISDEIARLLKNNNTLTRKEVAKHPDTLVAQFDGTMEAIKSEAEEMALHLRSHRRYLLAKSRFVKRHYKNV